MKYNFLAIFITIFIIAIAIISSCILFVNYSRETKIESIKEWLKYAVCVAEKELGEKTGQLKLLYVYNMALKVYPWIANVITFDMFSIFVDEALDWMNEQLTKNKSITVAIGKE